MKPVYSQGVLCVLGSLIFATVLLAGCGTLPSGAIDPREAAIASQSAEMKEAVAKVKPALVRIKVVSPRYREGREQKGVSFGSGVIITPDGYVVTNHHVAGDAVQLVATLANREEVPAVLIGTDPATDIAVIKLTPPSGQDFPHARFGDSDLLEVGDPVLALGSPQSISQSATLGIVSNTEMITPPSYRNSRLLLDGEDVGELVRWIGHDAAIFPGNSGGPLINLDGEIIGVNEIGMGLGGAIPGNLAREVAFSLIGQGEVLRSHTGMIFQPLLKGEGLAEGVLVASVLADSPAREAGVEPGDVLLSVGGERLEGRFAEDLPGINNLLSNLPIGAGVEMHFLREGEEFARTVTPERRQRARMPQSELREWGMTARDLSVWTQLDLARETSEGVLITSTRSGGPVAQARPELRGGDVIVSVGGRPVRSIAELKAFTDEEIEVGEEGVFVPVVVTFEREAESQLAVVQVGIDRLSDPGRDVRRGWLPMETQVLTREIAQAMDMEDIEGVRITRLYSERPEDYPFEVGDIITHLDGDPVEASRPVDAEVFNTMVRQYRAGIRSEFRVLREGEPLSLEAEIQTAPARAREMRRYRDLDFEFVVREAAFNDRERPVFAGVDFAVLVDGVTSGGWADLAGLSGGDAILSIQGEPIQSLEDMERVMDGVREYQPSSVVVFVRRGSQNLFLEFEPTW